MVVVVGVAAPAVVGEVVWGGAAPGGAACPAGGRVWLTIQADSTQDAVVKVCTLHCLGQRGTCRIYCCDHYD